MDYQPTLIKLDRITSTLHSSGLSDIQKIKIVGKSTKAPEAVVACQKFNEMIAHRNDYVFNPKKLHPDFELNELKETSYFSEESQQKDTEREIVLHDGVFFAPIKDEKETLAAKRPYWADSKIFFDLLSTLFHFAENGAAKTLAYNRLSILAARFELHVLLNEASEFKETMNVPHRDFYNIYKVDNHVHHSACMNHKAFLKFMKRKMKTESNVVVAKDADGKELTLDDVMNLYGLKPYNISIDVLDMHAHKQTYQRFDKFNQKYNPGFLYFLD